MKGSGKDKGNKKPAGTGQAGGDRGDRVSDPSRHVPADDDKVVEHGGNAEGLHGRRERRPPHVGMSNRGLTANQREPAADGFALVERAFPELHGAR